MPDLQPGDIVIGDSGTEWIIGDAIGRSPGPGSECDAPDATRSVVDGHCRCVVCARCGHHTGNAHQGHYWKHCKVLGARLSASLKPGRQLSVAEWMARTSRDEFHFCCNDPAYGCELEPRETASE